MIERAKNLAADARAAEFVVGDSEQLPFADEGFTALLCTASLHHYPKPERALAEIARVLAPGGRFVLADGTADRAVARVADRFLRLVDSSHVRLYRTDELVAMLAGAGLETTDVRHLWDGGFAIIASRKTSGG
jgi:ubiquinone/menaquinone biosynthesis C-methylase UbiE